jgi:hypothetical protein
VSAAANSGTGDRGDCAERTFPAVWGANCPPADANAASGTVFRRVRGNPIDPNDFLSWTELGHKVTGTERICQANGLSVFRSIEDARAYADRYPDSGQLIATANFNDEDGKIKATPRPPYGDSHTTWWPFDGVDRCHKFRVLL